MGIFSRAINWLIHGNPKPQKKTQNRVSQAYKLLAPAETTCRNCGSRVKNHSEETEDRLFLPLTCPSCGFSWTKTWLECGLSGEEDQMPSILSNPNPQRIKFGIELGNISTPTFDKYYTELLDRSDIKARGVDCSYLESLFDDCASAEMAYHAQGYFPPPRPYQTAAAEARFHEDFEIEEVVCKRFIDLASFERTLQKQHNKSGGAPWLMPFYLEAKERLGIISIQKNMPRKAIAYVFEPRETTAAEKKQKLFTQCADHGIPIDNYAISYSKARKAFLFDADHYFSSPSKAFLHHLRSQGWRGTDYEFHPVMQLMQAACLNRLERAARELYGGYLPQPEGKGYYPLNMQVKQSGDGIEISSGALDLENPYARTFNVQVQMYDLDESAVIDDILHTEKTQIQENWHKIYSDSQVRQWFCGLEWQDMEVILDAIGRKRLAALAQDVFLNPSVNAIGWPDVWAVKDGNLSLFEIKSGDCLRDSQIWTFTTTMRKRGFEGKVVRLKKLSV